MGQKVNPHGLRVGVIKNWDSRWFAKKNVFGDTLVEDYNLRKYLKKALYTAGIAKIEIERDDKRVRLHLHCAKPGMVIGRNGAEIEKLRATCEKMLGKTRKILAIGETGLDYSKCVGEETKETQKKWFQKFVELSLHQVLPLVIHCRDAYHDLIKILSEYYFPWKPGVVHCFSGSVEEGKKLVDMGFYLGIGGKIVREEDLRSVIKEIPLEAIVLETDAPYLSPIPGEKVNTSNNLGCIIEELAKLKGITKGEVMWTTLENTYNLYPKLRHRI